MQPFLRSFLAGALAATSAGLGLLVTVFLLASGDEVLFAAVLSTGTVVAFVVGTPLTATLVGLTVAHHAGGRLRGLLAGLLCGAVGQFILLVATVLALGVAIPGSLDALVPQAEDGISAAEFTTALLTLVPAGLTAGLVALAASGRQTEAHDDLPDLAPAPARDAPDLEGPGDEGPEPAGRTLTCPRCHTPNDVPPGGGRITCRECGLVGRAE